MKARFKKVLFGALIVFAVGAIYALLIRFTHFSIPCFFRLITGLKCPGCGITGMCLALLRLDIKDAFDHNQLAFCLLPLMLLTAGRMIYSYVKYNRTREKLTQISLYVMIAAFLVFGVLRNIL